MHEKCDFGGRGYYKPSQDVYRRHYNYRAPMDRRLSCNRSLDPLRDSCEDNTETSCQTGCKPISKTSGHSSTRGKTAGYRSDPSDPHKIYNFSRKAEVDFFCGVYCGYGVCCGGYPNTVEY